MRRVRDIGRLMVLVVGLFAAACGDQKDGAGAPADVPLPPGGSLQPGADALNLPGEQKFVYQYEGKSPAEVADEVRAGFTKGGWSVTWDKVEGNRFFVSAERGEMLVDTTAFPLEKTTLTISLKKKAAARAQEQPLAKEPPPAAAPPAADGAPPGWPKGFPFLGGQRDPGYPPEPSDLPAFLYVFKSEQPDAVAERARTEARAAGYICTDGRRFTCLMRSDGSQVSVNADFWPEGGTALFVSVMPVLPPELR
jgi:hypothetical protein